jgi:uncharacterized protein YneF (UPF0154 family)
MAKNLNEFINTACTAVQNTLNSEVGQGLVQKLLDKKLAENPNMTEDEWNKTKQEFMTFMFFKLVKENPEIMSEMAKLTYEELNEED